MKTTVDDALVMLLCVFGFPLAILASIHPISLLVLFGFVAWLLAREQEERIDALAAKPHKQEDQDAIF